MLHQEVLGKLFGSETQARTLKFLLHHSMETFRVGEVAREIKSNYNTTHSYLQTLEEIGFLKKVKAKVEIGEQKSETSKPLYGVNKDFDLYQEIKALVLKAFPVNENQTVQKLNELGKIRMALLMGVFLGRENAQIDFFVVGDDIEPRQMRDFVKELEADVGKKINFTVMETSEFTYRFNIYDRFVRSVFQKPHRRIIDTLKV